MVSVGVHVEGLDRVTRALDALGVDLGDMRDAHQRIADEGARLAAAAAPRRTGRLARSVRARRRRGRSIVTAGGWGVPYAGVINYGWRARNIAPARFMQEADARWTPRAVQLLGAAVEQEIRRKGL